MESALLLDELVGGGADLPGAGTLFGQLLRERHGRRFRAYAVAQTWVSFPRFVDYVARRASASPYVNRKLSEFLAETDLPDRVFSWRGVWRLMTAR